ncbi:MAG: zinc-binding dehydrogenase [Actinomycetota bacterium]|nr:zinc-binding dehydrogenase [Actinomycetota bacterium]
MRAALVDAFGESPEVADVTPPERARGQVLVRVSAAPINKLDLLISSGRFYGGAPAPPYVPGVEGVGTIVEAKGIEPGTRVWFAFKRLNGTRGSMAELCAIDEARTLVLEHDIDDATAAGLGLTGLAAWLALSQRGRLASGEQVLVLGAAGATGQIALQAARILGAGRVIGASRSEEGRAIALQLGADAVVDSSGEDAEQIATRLERACDGPLALIIDPVWGVLAAASARVLAPGGRLVNFGSTGGPTAPLESTIIRSKSLSVLGYSNMSATFADVCAAISTLHRHAAEGRIKVLSEEVGLDEIDSAFERADASPHRKLIVMPDTSLRTGLGTA